MSIASTRPLDAAVVARAKVACDELTRSPGGLYWLQSDPDAGGAVRLMRWREDEQARAVSPPQISIGSWLHGYGGGSFVLSERGAWITSARDSSLHFLRNDGRSDRVVPDDGCVYGDLAPAGDRLLAVRERPGGGDEIVEVTAGGKVRALVSSPGFLGAPRLGEGGLLFLEWQADQMPWDATSLCLATYALDGELGAVTQLAGGPEESVIEPVWGPDGAAYFMSDRTGWWNLYRWDRAGTRRLFAIDRDCAAAPWEGGYRSYAFLAGERIALTVHDGLRTRVAVARAGQELTGIGKAIASVKPYLAAIGRKVAVIGASSTQTPSVLLLDPEIDEARGVAAVGQPPASDDPPGVSRSEVRELIVGAVALKYLLRLPSDATAARGLPLLVRAHPGPTDDVPLRRDVTADFFTSRGFAVVDVAYRGSSGQGRAFRQLLHGHWGEYDVEDCAAVAAHLLSIGLARPGAVFISGASAGGYTALQSVCTATPFVAATATSAIIDPDGWGARVPRFQRPHAAVLAGPAGGVRAERVTRPVLLIHGSDDFIAPVQDVIALAEQLRSLDDRHRALFLDGGGHYLSDPHCREAALNVEWEFYRPFIEV